jgi:hypothetical protein
MSLFADPQSEQLLYGETPILRKSRGIRLLRVYSGQRPEYLSCDLHQASLDSNPRFKALSYTWANRNESFDPPTSLIQCNGMPFYISENLNAALKRVRDVQQPVEIWVDSICINQKNISERSSQVGLMRDIYQSSEEVVIWLGERGTHDILGEHLFTYGNDCSATTSDASYIDWFGDQRDTQMWELFLAEQKRGDAFDVRTRNVFGAFCIIWLLSVGVVASNIVHLRHLSESANIINGLHAIMEQHWVSKRFGVALTWSLTKCVAVGSDVGRPRDRSCNQS